MQFLSAEWLAALDEAAKDLVVDDDTSLLIEQRIRTDTASDVVWHTRVAAGVVRFVPGPAPEADIRLSCDQVTALALSQGQLSAPRAFLDGRLHLDGDISALTGARSGLDAMADVFALVRAGTDVD